MIVLVPLVFTGVFFAMKTYSKRIDVVLIGLALGLLLVAIAVSFKCWRKHSKSIQKEEDAYSSLCEDFNKFNGDLKPATLTDAIVLKRVVMRAAVRKVGEKLVNTVIGKTP